MLLTSPCPPCALYKDLSLFTFKESDAIFNFLGLQKSLNIKEYTKEHTFSKREDEEHFEDHHDKKKVKNRQNAQLTVAHVTGQFQPSKVN